MKFKIPLRSAKEWLFVGFVVILIFQMALQISENQYISFIFNYADEVIAAFMALCVLVRFILGYKFEFYDKEIFYLSAAFLITGLIGSVIHRYQPIEVAIIDMFTCAKFIIGYFGVRVIWDKNTNPDFIRRNLVNVARLLTIIFFVLAIHEEFFTPWFNVADERFGGISIALFYPHPTYLAASSSILLIILAVSSTKKSSNFIYMLMITCVIIFTFRSKAMGFAGVFWGLYLLSVKLKIKSKVVYAAISIPMAIYIGYDQILKYFITSTKTSARSIMLLDSIQLAKSAFPFGMGYATFGSNMSAKRYSPVYYLLGYNEIFGLSKEHTSYLNDGFWQIIFGQFGVIGFILFIFIIIAFFRTAFMFKPQKVGFSTYDALISLNIYLVISSTAEPAYFAPFALLYFMLFAMIVNQNKSNLEAVKIKTRIKYRTGQKKL